MTSGHADRLVSLRKVLAEAGLNGFIVPRADEHLGEYVPESAERLQFISGFTGSAGLAIVLADRAAVFSDGRYTLQLAEQTDPALWERHHIIEEKPELWLQSHAAGSRVGYDPWLISADGLKKYEGVGVVLVPVTANPIDAIWAERPAPPMHPAVPHPEAFTGEPSTAKRARLGQALREAGQDVAILSDPAALAWLFNIRGGDVEFTPIALGYALLRADGTATLFMPAAKLPAETRAHLGNAVELAEREALPAALDALRGKTVRYDPASMPVWFKTRLEAAGAAIAEAPDPVALPRALKNVVEQSGARAAQLRDGAAVTRFLAWFAQAAPTGAETEISAAERLLAARAQEAHFRGESFPAISGAGEHGAIMHYRVTPESNRAVKPNEFYLIDSGAQYLDGTTDITRTLWTGPDEPPAEAKDRYTRVLAGHIALAQAVFPVGIAGAFLDTLARAALWQAGLDYDHGTGHGIGSYLSVHEGPAGIARTSKTVPLAPGMILSNEPGYYLNGGYGIRLENLILVEPADFGPQPRKFLRFETITLAPFERRLIEPALLSAAALGWLNAYHATVREQLTPLLPTAEQHWLEQATAPIYHRK